MATAGMSPHPADVTLNENSSQAANATAARPATSRTALMTISPARNSISRSGDTMRLTRLRDHVSSRKPHDIDTLAWYMTCMRRIPESM